MKKIFSLFIFFTILISSSLFADWVVPTSALPQKAQDFISQKFQGASIYYVEKDDGKYEVKLSNGVEIDFSWGGDWVKIDGNYTGVSYSVLPANVVNTIKNTYPDSVIIKVEKTWGTYEIKLNNMMELYISSNGQLLGQKFDD